MTRLNKTKGNLQIVWNQLDEASGNLYNALDNLANMVDLPDDVIAIKDSIDVTAIDAVKNLIEAMIEEKDNEHKKATEEHIDLLFEQFNNIGYVMVHDTKLEKPLEDYIESKGLDYDIEQNFGYKRYTKEDK